MKAFEKSKQIYKELKEINNKGESELEDYLDIMGEYVQIERVTSKNPVDMTLSYQGREEPFYFNTLSGYKDLIDDITKVIYKLYGGKEYKTYEIIDEIESSLGGN